MSTPLEPIDLFYSYAHEDEDERDELDQHLALLKRRRVVRTWWDRAIVPGEDWRRDIDRQLDAADVILLLVSKSFFASDFIWEKELRRALQRHEAGTASVVPIVVKAVDLEDAPFNEIQTLPTDRRPVTSWSNRDEAWVDVVKGIRRAIARVARPAAEPGPAVAPAPPPAPRPEPAASPGTEHLVADFARGLRGAHAARLLPVPSFDELLATGESLADVSDPKRVLWVDDHPENNRSEIAALRRMQFEVQTRVSTEEGLAALAGEGGAYDLVISDWSRRTLRELIEPEGLRLLRAIRARGLSTPVALYHGTLSAAELAQRRSAVAAAGGQLATFSPSELFEFIRRLFAQR